MSATTLYDQGLKAAERKDFAAAVPLLTRAIEASGATHPNPAWLLTRARAEMGIQAYQDALDDADRAYQSALTRQSAQSARWLVQAQYRRAVALAALKRYADADACCVWSQQLAEGKKFRSTGGGNGNDNDGQDDPDDVRRNVDSEGRYQATPADLPKTLTHNPGHSAGSATATAATAGGGNTLAGVLGQANSNDSTKADWTQAYMWRGVVLRELQKLPLEDPGRKITVSRVPALPKKRAASATATPTPLSPAVAATTTTPTASTASTAPTPTPTPSPPKLRVDMYQTPSTVNLTLYAKGVDAAALQVTATSATHIQLARLPAAVAGPAQTVTLALAGAIAADAGAVETRVTPYKIELKVTKATAGEKWGHWGEQANVVPAETAAPATAAATATTTTTATATATATSTTTSGPAYPTSAKSGPKNWDKVADDDDDDAANANVDDFFKKLYAGSTPEQQRAMMKSFTESNGTSLSTDWSTVGKGPVAVVPPDGVEAKKW
ncbi:sgt1 and cs domain containing protein [Sporothrix brasiliensis 5110]|uniref:Sgt1 and cs domain containing protein n=1 Tax=Sporothrix brasiliensis 5110 TaxID=1398154 RepID=A0A0C2EM03_9PEZI|nr:sgt1 and cs domain containing protein [Sporothrix brasiliensis 5110]KIH87124.1 sgt1 and cs domain containing protein [Sporothrix brasiliensis 5110]